MGKRLRAQRIRVDINAVADKILHQEKTFGKYINTIMAEFKCTWEEAKAIYHQERKEIKQELFWDRVNNEFKKLDNNG